MIESTFDKSKVFYVIIIFETRKSINKSRTNCIAQILLIFVKKQRCRNGIKSQDFVYGKAKAYREN